MRRKTQDKTSLEADTVGYMPERFITGYFELVRLGLKADPSGQVFDNESTSVKKKYHQHTGGLKDEAALRFKAWVDRQLRAIGRDVQAYLNARGGDGPSPIGMSSALRREVARDLERKTELKCHGCGKYISWQWAHCAWCGKEIHGEKIQDQRDRSYREQVGGSSESPFAADYHGRFPDGEDSVREDGDEAGRHAPSEERDDRDS